jgi:MscS family membrane protein
LFILAGIYILDIFGINITPLLAGVGIGGIALAFAAQKVLADVFGGISLLLDEAYFLGDRIKVGDLIGTVTDIGLRSTKIKTFDNNIVTIPNSVVANSNIENFNSMSKEFVIRFSLGLTYSTTVKKMELAKKLIIKCIKSNKYVIGEPTIAFNAFNSSSLDLYISFTIDNYLNKLAAMDEINTKIKAEFDKNKIEFAFPSQTIYLSK